VKTKVIEKIIERVPAGLSLQLSTFREEIFKLNDDIIRVEKLNHELKGEIKAHEKYATKLEREVVSLNKQLKRSQSDFNQAQKNSMASQRRLEAIIT